MPWLYVGDRGHYFDGGDNENAVCFFSKSCFKFVCNILLNVQLIFPNRYFLMVCDFNDCLEKVTVVKVKNSR